MINLREATVDDFKDRIEKVEETLSFNEHNQDQLSEQLASAFKTLELLNQRLLTLERRLTSVEEAEAETLESSTDEAD